jgi:hypothetical protein
MLESARKITRRLGDKGVGSGEPARAAPAAAVGEHHGRGDPADVVLLALGVELRLQGTSEPLRRRLRSPVARVVSATASEHNEDERSDAGHP